MERALGSRRTQLMPREGRGRDVRADAVGGRATEVPSGGQAECERSWSRNTITLSAWPAHVMPIRDKRSLNVDVCPVSVSHPDGPSTQSLHALREEQKL